MNVRDLAPNVAILAPFAPSIIIEQALADTARDFCRRTTAWRVPVSQPVQAGDEEVTPLLPTAEAVVCNVIEAWFDQAELTNGTLQDLMGVRDGGTPQVLVQTAPTTLVLGPKAPRAATLRMILALAPARTSTVIGDDVGEEFAEPLQYGAAWRALRMVGTEWYAPREASAFGGLYAEAIEQARLRSDRITTRRARVVQYGG